MVNFKSAALDAAYTVAPGPAALLVVGGDIDDAARYFSLHHAAGGLLGQEDGAFEIDADDGVKEILGKLQEGGKAGDSGIIDQQIDAAEFAEKGLHEGCILGHVRHVGPKEDAPPALLLNEAQGVRAPSSFLL